MVSAGRGESAGVSTCVSAHPGPEVAVPSTSFRVAETDDVSCESELLSVRRVVLADPIDAASDDGRHPCVCEACRGGGGNENGCTGIGAQGFPLGCYGPPN